MNPREILENRDGSMFTSGNGSHMITAQEAGDIVFEYRPDRKKLWLMPIPGWIVVVSAFIAFLAGVIIEVGWLSMSGFIALAIGIILIGVGLGDERSIVVRRPGLEHPSWFVAVPGGENRVHRYDRMRGSSLANEHLTVFLRYRMKISRHASIDKVLLRVTETNHQVISDLIDKLLEEGIPKIDATIPIGD